MKQTFKKILLSLLFAALIVPTFTVTASKAQPFTKAQCAFQKKEQKLWIDHVSWTRSYITSAIASLKDQEDVLARLLKNQEDIGKSIRPYYGEEAGNKLALLLKDHIKLAGEVLDAAKANNKTALEEANKLWYKNADDIAAFLSQANPNYSEKELKDMLYAHLQFLTSQVVARLKGDWNADITAYDKGEEHMIHFATYLADGIVKQFPEKFK